MTDPRDAALEDCLQQIRADVGLSEALAHYPQLAEDLRPGLEAALAARSLGAARQVPEAAQARSRAHFLAEAQRQRRPRWTLAVALPPRRAWAALAVVMSLALVSAGTVAASAQALPGDTLYPVKRAAESTRLWLTRDPAERLELEEAFDRERVREVEVLLERRSSVEVTFAGALTLEGSGAWRVAGIRVVIPPPVLAASDVSPGFYVEVHGVPQSDGTVLVGRIQVRQAQFSGQLESHLADRWVVSGIVVEVVPETIVRGTPVVGGEVRVQAVVLGDGSLQARYLEVLTPLAGTASPAPSSTPTVEPTETRELTHTPAPTQTPEPSETRAPTRTAEPSRTPEPTEKPEPTEVREPTHAPEPTEAEEATEAPESTEVHEATPSPEPSHTSEPDETHEPTHTPEPSRTPASTQAEEPTKTPTPTS